MRAFFRTPRYAGLGVVVAFALFCGVATAESPPIVTEDPYPCQRAEWADTFAPPRSWYTGSLPASWDAANPSGIFSGLVRAAIREAGWEPYWSWDSMMLPYSQVHRPWLSVEQVIGLVMWCESRHNPDAVGDAGQSHGLFQIHLGYNPEVSVEQARDPKRAIAWSVPRLLDTPEWWSCFRRLRDGEA